MGEQIQNEYMRGKLELSVLENRKVNMSSNSIPPSDGVTSKLPMIGGLLAGITILLVAAVMLPCLTVNWKSQSLCRGNNLSLMTTIIEIWRVSPCCASCQYVVSSDMTTSVKSQDPPEKSICPSSVASTVALNSEFPVLSSPSKLE